MTISINGGDIQHGQTWQSYETLTQSTATSNQTISTQTDVTILGMGTATGFARNRYLLSTSGAVEGQEKLIISQATGEAYVLVNNVGPTQGLIPINVGHVLLGAGATTVDALQAVATATGCLVFQAADDMVLLKFYAGNWRFRDAVGATFATAT